MICMCWTHRNYARFWIGAYYIAVSGMSPLKNKKISDFLKKNVDMHQVQDKFLRLLTEGAVILDFGCGSGRDTRYFLDKGYDRLNFVDGPVLLQVSK